MGNYYHIKTKEDHDSLMVFLEALGYSWSAVYKPTECNFFKLYREKTVIEANEKTKSLVFQSTHYFEHVKGITDFIEWTPELAESVYSVVVSTMRQLVNGFCSLPDTLEQISKALEEATKKEMMYEVPLPGLETTDDETQYLSYKNKKWFASRKNTWLKQRFTESELKEKVPEFYRELAVKVDE
ncbi:hypothetical protein [Enterococcus faecalis]|uniref:hypothetical protein n=1 Tax=Enterococcus faecalis TaxID=1351 RepID=UPI000353350E|nr:hypothetical protein [Enterococcus faecalis]EPH69941.1 hypothetical protein D928_02075 [Enterococcus faecalis 20-SD-BW-06]EPI02042.1 hypothetical protein D919_01269 [Enterococcus faecalis 20-SD-BW-08]